MAPEVWEGHYTRSSDVFSLGLVMFVICELPDPLEPMAHFLIQSSRCALGELMHINIAAKCIPATSLLNAKKSTSDEKKLFNEMLQYKYQSRPAVGDVVRKLKDMEERRREEQRREEQRRQEEQRRREEQRQQEKQRRREEERRQAEQWNWCKCNVM